MKYLLFIYMSIIIMFPSIIILERFIPFLGSLVTGLTIVLPILMLILRKNKTFFWKYILLFGAFFISSKFTTDQELHTSHIIPLLIIFLSIDLSRDKWILNRIKLGLKERVNVIELQLWLSLIVNILTIPFSFGYSISYSMEWGVKAFNGIFVDPHQLAYRVSAIILYICIILLFKKKARFFILLGGLEFIVLLSGARTATMLAVALGLIALMSLKDTIKISIKSNSRGSAFISQVALLTTFIGVGISAIFAVLYKSTFMQKMIETFSTNNFDNGRASLIESDIELFKQSPMINKIFGNGSEAVYILHEKVAYKYIWAHNDFVQILVGMGLIALTIYCIEIVRYIWSIVKTKKFTNIILGLIIVFVAYNNGLYIHPRFTAMFPLIMLIL